MITAKANHPIPHRSPEDEGDPVHDGLDPLDAPGGALLDSMDAVRSITGHFRKLFAGFSGDEAGADRIERRPAVGSPSAVEHVLCLRDLLHATTDRLERLSRDARPVRQGAHLYQPVAGYHRWELEEVLRNLGAEAERLARAAERLSADDGMPAGIRHGVESIAAELLRQVLRHGAVELDETEFALRS